ncbi:CLIP domain-containing serine protease B14-like [Anopheles marshallii]|uniref:CLIP domain-containing serine protease B14-like n=1 Tax=Anopheles marshallii TaxID=1521116 RepID=UPI00237BB073|nr:CLIP domain-containing serine protease B14-like [Anopheles marshallii]
MYSTWRIFCNVVCLMLVVQCHAQESEPCFTPSGTAGRCIRVRDCGYVKDLMRKDLFYYNDTEYLEKLLCSTRPDGFALVCCPQFTNEPRCGPSAVVDRIMGGNDTEIGEYPWMALLRFQTRNHKISSNCAGTLINKRFVLTAAHCHTSAKKKGWVIHSVRLAEWNFMNHRGNKDCKQLERYDIPVCRKDYDVERFVVHPDYHNSYGVYINDIALIELATDVEYNVFVTPICLPVDATHLQPDDTETEYTAAGWGSTDNDSGMSSRLKQINLRKFDLEQCSKQFQSPNDAVVGVEHICAGGVRHQDTCHGDSGGPLMESVQGVWYLAGITSFGWPRCGKNGVPGVYTNVSHYMGWIAQEMYRGKKV